MPEHIEETKHILRLDDLDVEQAVVDWVAKHYADTPVPDSATWDPKVEISESGEFAHLRGYEVVWHTQTKIGERLEEIREEAEREERRQQEERAMEDHFRKHPHG